MVIGDASQRKVSVLKDSFLLAGATLYLCAQLTVFLQVPPLGGDGALFILCSTDCLFDHLRMGLPPGGDDALSFCAPPTVHLTISARGSHQTVTMLFRFMLHRL
jgi:hypothetical protein